MVFRSLSLFEKMGANRKRLESRLSLKGFLKTYFVFLKPLYSQIKGAIYSLLYALFICFCFIHCIDNTGHKSTPKNYYSNYHHNNRTSGHHNHLLQDSTSIL